jgi:hypothetical protein
VNEILSPSRRDLLGANRGRLMLGLEALAVFGVCLALFAVVQYAAPGFADHDGYYHMKFARLMRELGPKPAFVWLPLSILNPNDFYDHHFLYHVYLALFAGSADPASLVAGGKLASVLLPALLGPAVWWLLRAQGVRWAAVWSLGLFSVSAPFLYRMSMPRAQAASLLVLILAVHWLLQRRHWLLLPLGFAYVWLYDAFPLLLVVAGVYVAAAWATERKLEWRAVAYPAAGLALGLVFNPYFPQDLQFIFSHLAAKLGPSSVPVGNEWSPYQTWTLVQNSAPALAAFALGALALGWRRQRIDRAGLTTFGLAVVFGVMLLKSRRFVEYYPAFALIFLALTAGPLLADWASRRPRWARLAPFALATVMGALMLFMTPQARALMADSVPPTRYAGASAWLKANSSPGSLVFQTDWDDFPHLFFYNSQNVYTAGLDPTYMELYDSRLYAEWVKITQGDIKPAAEAIRADFGAEFVMSDLSHRAFMRAADSDPGLVEVYRDQDAVVYRLTP